MDGSMNFNKEGWGLIPYDPFQMFIWIKHNGY